MFQTKHFKKSNHFNAISVSIASPEDIESWSHGEVTKPETINYRTQKPEMDGLFCERIFGPTKNWECFCGKYKRIRYQGVVCEKCGVEVTRSIVRRERMGSIDLAVPVTHIWFLRSTPSRIGLLIDLPIKSIEQVVYFAAYIVTEVDNEAREEALKQLKEEYTTYKKQIIEEHQKQLNEVHLKKGKDKEKEIEALENEHALKIEELKSSHEKAKKEVEDLETGSVLSEIEYRDMNMKFGHVFRAGTGAESLREIIAKTDLKQLLDVLNEERLKATGQRQKKIIKRIKLVSSLIKARIQPEWMIITKLPVIPPDLRPMVQLDGGRFAASDLNDLYRRVINRNNRLKKLLAIGAPEVICRNEKRMLQEAVDTLLNNSARAGKTVFTAGDRRKLRSLSDMLKGKQGRFRQNLLGKRVDYSGRSVIVVGPQLNLDQCGLPKEMALKLFKPFVIGELIRQEYAHNVKGAERLIQLSKKEVWDILERVIQGRLVLLNRAPTLHRLGIQAFQPVLIEGKAIQIHPLVCAAFNADFDGDQMAVHLPLAEAAQNEAKEFMLSRRNILKPSAGEPIITPTQDMVLGAYFLTQVHEGKKGEGMVFGSRQEALLAHDLGHVDLQANIKARLSQDAEIVETSVGRIIFNTNIPEELGMINKTVRKGDLANIIAECFEKCGLDEAAKLADALKEIGFEYATQSGVSIGVDDMIIPDKKDKKIAEATEVVQKITDFYQKGLITEDERYNHAIKIWSETKSEVSNYMIENFEENKENDIYYMIDSGARGNWGQITQMCGMKGLVANPGGKTIELPIKSSLKEGFNILEYFIATHGGRKGKSDTALKTAEAGYLTRRLVDAVQDVIVREEDCGSEEYHVITREESEDLGVAFENRIFGRTLAEDLKDVKGKSIIAKKGEEVNKGIVDQVREQGISEAKFYSVMTCMTENGICQKCYGRDLGTNARVEIGTPVGIIAAQSIGEPGTQLTMRTFHQGGVAEGADITQGLTRVEELFEARAPKTAATLARMSGKIASIAKNKSGIEVVIVADGKSSDALHIPSNFKMVVKDGEEVQEKQTIAKSTVDKDVVKATCTGTLEKTKEGYVVRHMKGLEMVYKLSYNDVLRIDKGQDIELGQPLNAGHYNLREMMQMKGVYPTQKYIMNEVQNIYASQGQTVNDKHIEIISKKMFSKIRITEVGDSPFLLGEVIDVSRFYRINNNLQEDKKQVASGERLLLGLTRIALATDSWLSSASFQETIRVLVEAAVTRKIDQLSGLKENVIIGRLIPAGRIYAQKYNKLKEEGKIAA